MSDVSFSNYPSSLKIAISEYFRLIHLNPADPWRIGRKIEVIAMEAAKWQKEEPQRAVTLNKLTRDSKAANPGDFLVALVQSKSSSSPLSEDDTLLLMRKWKEVGYPINSKSSSENSKSIDGFDMETKAELDFNLELTLWCRAAFYEQLNVMKLLEEWGVPLNTTTGPRQMTALHYLCQTGTPESVRELLKFGVNVNTQTCEGLTALHIAIEKSISGKKVEYLLSRGAGVSLKAARGRTAIHSATLQNCEDNVKLLHAYGADVNVCDDEGQSPLTMAIALKNKSIVKYLLEKCGADFENHGDEGQKLLDMAEKTMDTEMIGYLNEYRLALRERKELLESVSLSGRGETLASVGETREKSLVPGGESHGRISTSNRI